MQGICEYRSRAIPEYAKKFKRHLDVLYLCHIIFGINILVVYLWLKIEFPVNTEPSVSIGYFLDFSWYFICVPFGCIFSDQLLYLPFDMTLEDHSAYMRNGYFWNSTMGGFTFDAFDKIKNKSALFDGMVNCCLVLNTLTQNMDEQECIPVGCVPPVLYRTGGSLCPGGGSLSRGVYVEKGGLYQADTLPPVNRMTYRCKNITFLQLRFRVVINQQWVQWSTHVSISFHPTGTPVKSGDCHKPINSASH